MDVRTPATLNTEEEHRSISPPQPASCFGHCGACGSKLVPDRSPQLLPCLHSLCQQCVSVDRRVVSSPSPVYPECPVCLVEYSLTEVIENLFYKKSQQITECGGCGGPVAGGWCVECGEALCPECVSAHKRVKVTRQHTVLPQKPPTVSVPTLYCSTHREEQVKLICQVCDQATCRECQLTLHRNHRFQFLHEAVADEKERIRPLMANLRLRRQEARRSLSHLDRRLLDLKELQTKLNDELLDTILSIRNALLKQATSLAQEVQELCDSERKSILDRQESLKKLEERQAYLLSFTETALDTEDSSPLLSYRRKIQLQLQDVMSLAVSPGDSMMKLTFHCPQDTYSRMATFGKIVAETVPFACTNHENANSKKNQCFSTTKTPPTCSTKHLTNCDNSLICSHIPASSDLDHPSVSSQTSTTLNSYTSTNNCTVSCHDSPNLSSTQIPMATSSGNPPTSTGNLLTSFGNTPTSSGNPPTFSGNLPTSSGNTRTSSGNTRTSSGNTRTSSGKTLTFSPSSPGCFQMPSPSYHVPLRSATASHTKTSSKPLILPYLLSTFPVITVPFSFPITLCSLPLNSVPVVPNHPVLNGQGASAETSTIQTAVNNPCRQTLPMVSQVAVLPETRGSCESMALDIVADVALPLKDQTLSGICTEPPVKALADSLCDSALPAGEEQEKCVDHAILENTPTSTVAEVDSSECTGDPSQDATPKTDAGSAGGITAAIDDSPVNGPSVSSLDSAGVDLQIPAHSPCYTGSMPENPSQANRQDQSDLFRSLVEEDDDDDNETDSDVGSDQEPRKADGRPALVAHFKALAEFVSQRAPPTGRKKCAIPVAVDTRPTIAEADGGRTCAESNVEAASKPDYCALDNGNVDGRIGDSGKTDDSFGVDERKETNGSEEKDNLYIENLYIHRSLHHNGIQKPREADKRRLVPRVSLVQLPVSFPSPGCPLPQFRLVPSANKQEVHLEQIPEENQSSFTECPSQKLCHIQWPLKRKRKQKDLLFCDTSTPVISKRAKKCIDEKAQEASEIAREAYLWNVTEDVRKECEKTTPNEDHIRSVLRETFRTRRAWINRQPPGKLLPICKLYPCFRLGHFIMSEFAMLLGDSKFGAIPQRAENFLNVMESMMGTQKEGELRMLPVLSVIEENTKFGKEESESVITVCKGAFPGEVQLDSLEMDPPRLVLHVTDDSLLDSFIVGDAMTICAQSNTVLDAVITLLGTYYTFHLQYPRIYSQALGFLQQHLLGDAYVGPRSSRFRCLTKAFVHYRKKAISTPNKNSSFFASTEQRAQRCVR